ncbi:glycine cleavage system protein GcvH [Staphylococcus pseudintermedius]|uniref:Glycine cleavage system H protein n=4 Tax=Staphylococcus TaxID=1279 RepID=A0A2A4GVB8_9STAP|nr:MULTISPECIES: glycine cleavage system protein GcvH [Staphylococcus intermedius group]ADV05056.1 Glycine cleavage system H protein [Staphylococcus pseudintermedius HKU10-03]ADX77180.1 glycine cleavage system H protein [Staphylococcus pseudintermedius ED99]ANQ82392.1 glycine cleavage system protein H [Staphylococcus pseudintermedius]ANS90257.1 Glycine cleavage system H protein [Staphylococcus pseudintermedius]ASQ51175.1 glycine cleavage system protein H [Staphylococcus pseudintermedius]
MAVPSGLKYSKEHEWVKVEGNTAIIGITDFAQSELGDIVFVELPEVEDELTEGETFGSVESVKTVSELYSPVSGKVVAVNENLEDAPEAVNESPYEEAWMVKVELKDESELDALLDAAGYEKMIGE